MPDFHGNPRFQPLVRQLLGQGLSVRFTASGRSMLPTIRDGDQLLVEPVNPSSIRRGDVVLAEYRGLMRAHRVIELPSDDRSAFVMRGDALLSPDAPLDTKQILGRVALQWVVARFFRATRLLPATDVVMSDLSRENRGVKA